MDTQLDFVAIGDITIDAFIKLKDVVLKDNDTTVETDDKLLCMRFGDKIEYEDVVVVPAVGNSPNAAVSAHRLGLKSALVTNIGDDDFGKKDLDALSDEGVNTDYVKVHEGKKSNYHYVLRHKAERTILVKHHEYPYSLPQFETPPKWLYLSSLGENSLDFHREIASYVKSSGLKLAFQPGTFQIGFGFEGLREIYEASELFFCNKEEAKRILGSTSVDEKVLVDGLHRLGPRVVVVTDGPNGAYTFNGTDMWKMPMYPDKSTPVDRTGAGDSFSSTFTSALALGLDVPTALSWGPINSMNVVQYIGAQKGLLTRKELEEFLTNRPAEYKAVRI